MGIIKKIANFVVVISIASLFYIAFSLLYKNFSNEEISTPAAPLQLPVPTPTQLPASRPVEATRTPINIEDSYSDYRTILLLERATGLMVTYIEKIYNGEITPDDASTQQLYLLAFAVAVDAYNHTNPSTEMRHAWNNIVMVSTAYAEVYIAISQGRMASSNDLLNLKTSRQWLVNYQQTEEAHMMSHGLDTQYFDKQKAAVEQLLLEDYGTTSIPAENP